MKRPSAGVKGSRNSVMGSTRESKWRSFKPVTKWVISDREKQPQPSEKPARLSIPSIALAATAAASRRRVLCFTSIQIDNEQNGVFSLALAKEKGSIEVHMTLRELRDL